MNNLCLNCEKNIKSFLKKNSYYAYDNQYFY